MNGHDPNKESNAANKGYYMISSVEKTDTEIKSDVLAELKYEPSVKVTDIGVLVKDGTVTLNGFATNYGEKWQAVTAAKRVASNDILCAWGSRSRGLDPDQSYG
jgi:hypothetical protein